MINSMPNYFNQLWNDAISCCEPETEIQASIVGIKCIFHSSCEWDAFFLKQLLSNHLVDQSSQCTHEHEIAIVLKDNIKKPTPKNSVFFWKGRMSDGTPVSMTKSSEDIVEIYLGEEVSILLNMAKDRTLCMISELHVDDTYSRRPQPGGFFIPLIHFLLSAYKLYVIHASAVAFQGRSLLMLGKSGVGKTTMSLALARAGMEFMGDDLIIVKKQKDKLYSYALLLKPKIEVSPGKRKRVFDSIVLEGLPVCRKADIAGIAFLQQSQDNSYKFKKSFPSTILTWLLEQGNDLRLMKYPGDWFDTAAAIAEKVPGWIWTVGHPNKLNVASVKEILNSSNV